MSAFVPMDFWGFSLARTRWPECACIYLEVSGVVSGWRVQHLGVRVIRNKQDGQGSAFDLWTMCSFGLDALLIQLGDPVAVKAVENIGNNKLCDCWPSCWGKLDMDGRDGMETMSQYPDVPGGYIPPGRAVFSSCSDDVKIKGYWGCDVVDRFVHIIPLLCFGSLLGEIGVTDSAGDVIYMTVLSHLGGGLLGRSVWLQQVSQWAGLQAPLMRVRWCTVVFFWKIRIPYKYPAFAGRDSLDTTPVTGSLHFAASGCRLANFSDEGLVLC